VEHDPSLQFGSQEALKFASWQCSIKKVFRQSVIKFKQFFFKSAGTESSVADHAPSGYARRELKSCEGL